MSIYQLNKNDLWFPEMEMMDEDLVAVGGDLRQERLLEAYRRGIFPWYNDPGDLMWFSPQLRSVLFLNELRISHSMRNELNKNRYHCTMDKAFSSVIEGCRSGDRKEATWIHDEIVEAYTALHHSGLCHSVEVWLGEELVGGLYGTSLGHLFFGESMFSKSTNASKFAFIFLAQKLEAIGVKAIDCQVPTSHLASLGARTIERVSFFELLQQELHHPTFQGNWSEQVFANYHV